jgi:DNA adenine methylase
MEKIKSEKSALLFRYPGGKYYALNILKPFWACFKYDEYREPFVGGGSVFFSKKKAKYNWLNDKDTDLITTYQVISNPELRPQLIDKLEIEIASKERWREILNFQPTNDLEIAYRYYYLNRTSFSGKMVSPGWGYRDKRSVPPERWHEKIEPCGEKLTNSTITNLDFEEVIKAKKQGDQVLMFVDPPYFSPPKKKHYRHGFEYQDHVRLSEVLKETEHKFFLTYDDVPEIRAMYAWAKIYEVNFIYRVDNSNIQEGTRNLGFELVITNYDLPKQGDLLF